MDFREIVNRLNGISTPVFGLSWNPATLDVDVARRVISHMESRRVLFASDRVEVPEMCLRSVVEIRQLLSEIIGEDGVSTHLEGSLRIMRRSAVRFLTRIDAVEYSLGPDARVRMMSGDPRWGYEMPQEQLKFRDALAEFRAGVGYQLAVIAAAHGLEIDDMLTAELPLLGGDS